MSRQVKKTRLDLLLLERGIASSVEKARAMIMAGSVSIDARMVDKPGHNVPMDAEVSVTTEDHPFVSRGGVKLRGALEHFVLDVRGMAVLDVGASTGGFTDCLLQAGARKVFAVDVGYGQLAWKLREDPRVVVIERTNIRYYDGKHLDEKPALAVIDVSFISLKTVIPAVLGLVRDDAWVLALIKPQFEARREEVGKNGVVADAAVHDRVVEEIRLFCLSQNMEVTGRCLSPLVGPAGNREYFILARKKL
ncbi:MAG TPA: TlyA family RNA methyltransferase [Smithellaceae bacterium]|jgi:23S rRNA (cytidine1920-2'-O)/16S rRNA (cytidine1409-2'-O)-methyltransferase|nr:TlyA family RNA methyltransferase [Smithellaceae bacterium]HQF83993.1 TlyA family RNA methyltransferase [Smithellaceae bacterium]HQG80482.1 TlyA family RNA methyltransferase [Smithellaceae bacterium]